MPKPVTIQRSLIVSFALVIVVLTALLLGITFVGARQGAARQSERLLARTLDEVEHRLGELFRPSARLLIFAKNWQQHTEPQTEADLQAMFRAIERAVPHIAAVRAEPFGTWTPADFDEEHPVLWRAPHPLAGSGVLGITAVTPITLPGGERALLAADMGVDEISRFTMGLKITEHSKVMVLIQTGPEPAPGQRPTLGVIGLPADERFRSPEARRDALMQRGENLGLSFLQDAFVSFKARGWARLHEPLAFETGGEPWWAGVRTRSHDPDLNLWIVALIPERDLLGDRSELRLLILGAAALALIVAILIALLLARRAGRPIEALVAQTDRIRMGDFRASAPIESRLVEVRRLAEAHEEMRAGLEQLMRMEHAMQVARAIQQGTFPSEMPQLPGYEVFGDSRPAEDTGGDTFDIIGVTRDAEAGHEELTQGAADYAVLLLADATGHGIGPALSVSQVRAMVRMATRLEIDLESLVREVNQQLCADLPGGLFITAWFGVLDPATHDLHTFSAGQGPILHYRKAEDRFESSGGNAPPLGLMELTIKLPAPTRLARGDLYVVLSDGFHEAPNDARELFGEDRIHDLLRAHADEHPQAMVAALHEAVDAFTGGAPPDDDRTCVIIKRV